MKTVASSKVFLFPKLTAIQDLNETVLRMYYSAVNSIGVFTLLQSNSAPQVPVLLVFL